MPLPAKIQLYLDRHKTGAQQHNHAPTARLSDAVKCTGLPSEQLIRAVLLAQGKQRLLAILPADFLLDFQALHQLTGTHWVPADRQQIQDCFPDCQAGAVPPLAAAYGLDAIVDSRIRTMQAVCLEPGSHDCLLNMPAAEFETLLPGARYGHLSQPLAILKETQPRESTLPEKARLSLPVMQLQPSQDIRNLLHQLEHLPALPSMAQRLLRLRNNTHATVQDLTDIIQADPSLSAQIIRYARSAFFSYKGRVETLEQAIGRVLGFETVMNMALGLAASRILHNPADGPLGLQAFWQHATFSAALAQTLASYIRRYLPINPGVAYLAGLLHNFGFLLEGHLLRGEFFLLNRLLSANPHLSVQVLEQRILGMDHTQIGALLMEFWNMPKAIIVTTREHHNETYQE